MKMPRSMLSVAVVIVLSIAVDIVAPTKEPLFPTKCPIPHQLKNKLHADPLALEKASTDYGNVVHFPPSSVLYPATIRDIEILVSSSYKCSNPFVISARGNGHSVQGQAMAANGVVVDMQEFRRNRLGLGLGGVLVSEDGKYADVGGEFLWDDVLNVTLEKGVMPVSLAGYLGLTVGGTLSNAGIGSRAFRVGPQVSNVYEMDVVTGKGKLVTCSATKNHELFYGVLGGLGQFGIITRARIPVEPAKPLVRWVRLLYSDFEQFTKDLESLISINGRKQTYVVGNLESYIFFDNGTPNRLASAMFSSEDLPKIFSLMKKHGVIYCLGIAEPYDEGTAKVVNKRLKILVKGLSPSSGMVYSLDIPHLDFLNRTKAQFLKNESHPWLSLFVPKSRILDFNSGVIRDILLKKKMTFGPTIFYIYNRSKWDQKMSVAIPDEEIFYGLDLLQVSSSADWQSYYIQNDDIIKFCDKNGIKYKTYLRTYSTKRGWIRHFGSKWNTLKKRKKKYDPKHILSPGQRIFN